MKKISIKREQSQAGLSFAEREKFRPQVKNKLLLLLVLLMTVSGAWAQLAITTDLADSYDAKVGIPITLSIEASNAQYYQWYKKLPQADAMIMFATSSSYTFTPKEAGETKFFCAVYGYNNDYVESKVTTVIATVPQTYSVTLADGTEDEGNWSVPKEAAEGSPVTVTYSGEKKVKSVKAVKKAAAPAPAPITVTINQSDWGSESLTTGSFTKDGVTVSAGDIDPFNGNLMNNVTFSTTLGNFTKIVVTAKDCNVSGTGWSVSGNYSSTTWAGTPASTVSFSGNINGHGQTPTTIVCTIVPKN